MSPPLCTFQKGYSRFQNIILIYISLAPLWSYSDKEKNQEILENQIRRACFSIIWNGAFGFSTDLCATIMLRKMRDFITKIYHSKLFVLIKAKRPARKSIIHSSKILHFPKKWLVQCGKKINPTKKVKKIW